MGKAYRDKPFGIGLGQTMASQPYIVAYMIEAAEISTTDKILEIGTGCGYQTAVLAELSGNIYTVELLPELAWRSQNILQKLGYKGIHFKTGDGYQGWVEHAPYDVILVTAAPKQIPQALIDQLAINGRMIIPPTGMIQELIILKKTTTGLITKRAMPVIFVPLRTQAEVTQDK